VSAHAQAHEQTLGFSDLRLATLMAQLNGWSSLAAVVAAVLAVVAAVLAVIVSV